MIDDTPSPTDFGFTGQRKDGFELYDYNARYYSAVLGRFISPDSIIPNPVDSKSFNRYTYVYNNPLRYIDPSGHQGCASDDQACWDSQWYRAHGYEQVDGEWSYTGNFHIERDNTDFYTQDGTLNLHQSRLELRGVAEQTWSDLGSLEAMIRVVEFAAYLSGGNAGTFMDLTIPVLSGETGTGIVWNDWMPQQSGQDPQSPYYTGGFLQSDGYGPMYADPDLTNNQAHHVWYEAQLAYYYGSALAVAANIYHETIDPNTASSGKSFPDVNAGNVGIMIGAGLRGGSLAPSGVANELRELGRSHKICVGTIGCATYYNR